MEDKREYKKMNDEKLMIKYQENDFQAFEVLYARHKAKVYGFLIKKLKDANLADEVFQNAFVKLHRKREQYDPEHPFLKWLFIIVNSEMLDYLKAQKPSEEFSEELHLPSQEGRDLNLDLAQVRNLSDNEKVALSLRYYEDNEFRDIAKKLETSPSNARKIVSLGVRKLKKAFAGGGLSEE